MDTVDKMGYTGFVESDNLNMLQILKKRIELPALTAIIVTSSLVTVAAGLLQNRVGLIVGTLCEEMAWFFGPLFCAFLWILLASEIFWKRGGHPWALSIGSLFGFGTFIIWIYIASHQ